MQVWNCHVTVRTVIVGAGRAALDAVVTVRSQVLTFQSPDSGETLVMLRRSRTEPLSAILLSAQKNRHYMFLVTPQERNRIQGQTGVKIGSGKNVSYYLIHTTYLVLFVAVLARQLCLPIPAILFLLSGGALAASGKLSYVGITLAAVLGCVLADLVWFEAGRLRGKRVLRLLCALAPDPSYCIRNSKATFAKKGVRALVIAKFIPGLDGICPPLAGMSGASRVDFILYDAVGSALWARPRPGASVPGPGPWAGPRSRPETQQAASGEAACSDASVGTWRTLDCEL